MLETLLFEAVSNGRGLVRLDIILLITIGLIWPLYSYFSFKRNPVEKLRKEENVRLKSYNITILQLWGLTTTIMAVWFFTHRSFETLGFQHSLDIPTAIVWGIAALGILFSAWQLYQVINNAEARQKIAAQLQEVGELTHLLMPKTVQEYRQSMIVAITAGITEEIIFRGYVIWALSLFMNPWAAGALSVGIFVMLHSYQERAGLIQVTAFAIIATVMYLVSGSLWPCIVLHIGVDILNITLAWKLGNFEN